jgi:AraC-like DNA-binding protein/DNA-binding XRE family transcriptional regulator
MRKRHIGGFKMSSVIGENIKKLRRERKITQEALAAHLGISCQAVSKWERGESQPDISTLVPLANFMRVSTDEILGLNTARREVEIEQFLRDYTELDAKDDTDAKIALVQKAYMTYPDDFRIVKLYTEYLCNDPAVEDGFVAHKMELHRACANILQSCPIESIRYHAMDILSQLYFLDNEDEKAIETLSGFPSAFMTKNQMVSMLFESGSDIRLEYSRRALFETLESLMIHVRLVTLEDTAFNRVANGFHQLLNENSLPSRDSLLCDYMLSLILLELQREGRQTQKTAVTNRMLEYIRLHCFEKLTLQDLARALGYSEDYLSRLFHENARCSFRGYVQQMRMARAKRELLGSVKSIQQIAELCGYSNAKFFSTVFLKQEGLTPSAYRNLYGGLHQNNA